MLESVIAYILRNYLGEYLENVSTDQLSFLLLSGCVEIENLPVRTDGIRKFGLPIEIKAGFVKKLKLKIPMSALKSQPWEILVQGLYVIVEPSELAKINEKEESEFETANKMKRLQKMEEKWREEQNQKSSGGSWTSKLLATILENLQVSIEQVHVRYEEKASADWPYSIGMKIGKLAAHSTDGNWQQNFTTNRAKSWKLVELTNLEVYTDNVSHHHLLFQPLEMPRILDSLGNVTNTIYEGSGHCYNSNKLYICCNLLQPVSCTAKVTRNRNPQPLHHDDGPRYRLYIELPNVKLSLGKTQYKSLVSTGDSFDMFYRSRAVRKWRPEVSVIGNGKLWWQFAFKVHQTRLAERNRRMTWGYITRRLSMLLFYTRAYGRHLESSVKLSRPEQSQLTEIEAELSFDEISLMRRIAMAKVEESISMQDGSATASSENYTSYWGSWLSLGWGATYTSPTHDTAQSQTDVNDISKEFLPKFSPSEFEEELDDFLELDSQTSNSFLFRDHQFASICFSMQEGSLSLYDPTNRSQGIVDMNFNNLKLQLDIRPRINYYRFDLSLVSIQILDRHHSQSFFPMLVEPIRDRHSRTNELFSLCAVKRKSKKFADLSISGQSQPLEVICNVRILSLLQEFFRLPYIPSGSNLEANLTLIFREKIAALKSYTVKEIRPVIAEALQEERWWSPKHLNLDLEISAPCFVLPEDFCLQESRAVIIDLGLFSLKTMNANSSAQEVTPSLEADDVDDDDDDFGTPIGALTPQERTLTPTDSNSVDTFEDYLSKTLLHKLYDRYQLDIKNLQILVTDNFNSESWKMAYKQSSTSLHVLDKLTVCLQLCRRLRFTCDPSESNIAITGALPRLDIHIDEEKFNTILHIQENFLKTILKSTKNSVVGPNTESVKPITKTVQEDYPSTTSMMNSSILWLEEQNYWKAEKRRLLMETKLLDASFTFQEVTLSFSHRNRVITQLRVPGIQLNHLQRPYDYKQSLTIQDVFVADAIQRFGTQYDLLIYSQGKDKYYKEDNGNLVYVSSPVHSEKSAAIDMFYSVFQVPELETNALLKLDREVIFQESPNSKFPCNTEIINANFTSLNIIANQETLVEILAFFNSLQIQSYKKVHPNIPQEALNKVQNKLSECRREIYAKFKCLTAKFVYSEGPSEIKEVALINGYGLELEMMVHDHIDLTGHLRGVSLDNIMEGAPNRRLLRVGQLEQASIDDNVDTNAFNFRVLYKSDIRELQLDFQLASVHYTHCSNFLFSVQQCFSEFQYYISKARESLESAAKDMAYSLFHKGEPSELFSQDDKTGISGEDLVISYNILVHAPTLRLENRNNRNDRFVFNLGEITITNRTKNEINPKFEHISILVRNIYMLAKVKDQSYRILENTNTKVEVFRKLDTNISMLECRPLIELTKSELRVSEKSQLVLFASMNEDIQVNLHKICFDSLKEIISQNWTTKKTSAAVSNPNPLANNSDRFRSDEGFETILFSAGCSVHNITLAISQDIGLETKSIVAFSTSNFSASVHQEEPFILTVDTKLGGVRGYDLLNDSKKKSFLVTSYLQDYASHKDAFCSYSTLPEIISYQSPLRSYELSLNESVLDVNVKKHEQNPLKMQDLVSTKITFVSPNHSEFSEFYQNITTHASVMMNHIHVIVNLQTWVLLLDFFGLTPQSDHLVTPASSVSREQVTDLVQSVPFDPLSSLNSLNTPLAHYETRSPYLLPTPLQDPDEVEVLSIPVSTADSLQSELPALDDSKPKLSLLLDVSINSLLVIFNKLSYPLTCNSATGFKSCVKMERGDISVVGELGKASLIDLSPHGTLYREKFVTHGENALYFDFFKYGESDPLLEREFDIRANFRMSSVRYVHTKRFLSENLAFCQHFFQLIDAFQRMKAKSSGNITFSGPNRHPRIKLDVSAACPIIFIPSHGFSPYLFIGELGHITVSNVFLFDGKRGTWSQRNRGDTSPFRAPERSKSPLFSPQDQRERSNFEKSQYAGPCLLDVMRIELQGNDVFTALFDTKDGVFVRENSRILKEKLNYKVLFEHNLHMPMCHKIPNFRFEVYITDSHCMVDKKQMDAFKTFLSKNLGETLEEFERPTSVIRDPIVYEDFEEKWIDISFCFIFQHVCLEFVSSRATHSDDIDQFLSRFYMHNTTLLIEIFSDSTKTIDFISRQMSIVDVRYDDYVEAQKPSIFGKVLLSRNDFESDPSTSSLQVEVHMKLSPGSMEFTILLNNLRMILMMDLAIQCWSFVADWSEEHENLFEFPEENTISVSKSSPPSSVQPQKSRDLQIKLSVTETDFVIIEDLTAPDTQALVCKGTTVMTFTKNPTYGFTCNLSGVELFSCCLASEEETALSIIDPLLITIEIPRNHTQDHSYPLNIEVQNVSTRLSYNDIKLFAAIFTSISNILEIHNISSSSCENSESRSLSSSINNPNDSLQTELDTYVIVEDNLKNKFKSAEEVREIEPGTFGEVILQVHEFKLVLIDDCGNCDFPLGEINLDRILVRQSLHAPFVGNAKIKLAMNYFNRNVSAWEPFIEPFKLFSEWKKESRFRRFGNVKGESKVGYPHYSCTFMSEDRLLINLTSSLLDILRNTQASWGQDLSQVTDSQPLGIPNSSTKVTVFAKGSATQLSSLAVRSISGFNFRKRNPFIPFRLENNTGLPLKFATLTKNPYKVSHHSFYDSSGPYVDSELRDWVDVPVGNSVSFEFEKKSKIRHQHLQQKTVHMLIVQVEGWKETKTPISTDQVGIVFRDLKPEISSLPSAKLIFSIKLDGAQKVINVRTPIAIKNELHFEMEIKLSGVLPNQCSFEYSLKPDCYASIPLDRQLSDIFIRPRGWGAQYPSHPLSMDRIERSDLWRVCVPFGQKELKMPNQSFIYTYCVKDTQKEGTTVQNSNTHSPCLLKTITLTHPFVIENLLPQEIAVEMIDLSQTKPIKPGASIPIISFTPSRGFSFLLYLDNFQKSHRIDISPTYSETPTIQNEIIKDEFNRPLQLKIIVSIEKCPARRVTIMTEYWLINKSNLPLLFREDNSEFEAAGQFGEHETARSLVPLPFSFLHSDQSDHQCLVRLGRSQLLPAGVPTWSESFRLQSRGGVVPVYMQISPDSVPVEYQLSVDIMKGSGRYKDTSMVAFENRFQLENLTSLPIRYIQDCQFENDTELITEYSFGLKQVICPNSVIPFNWPRLDRDHFLRVKYEGIAGVYWSCPFKVVEEDNFVLSMRSKEGNSHFVRVNIRQKNYAYIIRFSDTRNLPPPFIIENYSQVQIQYVQASIPPSYKHYIKPGNIKHYAWDEIMSEQKLKLFVDDIDESVVYDPSHYTDQLPKLYYENFFYIALYDTFTNESTMPGRDLVLNVNTQTRKVFFARKSYHPSQLWRKTGVGKIEHVTSKKQGFNFVLDVADPVKSAAFSGACMQLVLKEQEAKRDATQIWEFDEGLLTLASLPYPCVCAKILPVSTDSCDAVLVANPKFPRKLDMNLSLPSNHHIRILKSKPGSGMLSVRISTKGPSNIIKISDNNSVYHHLNITPLNWSPTSKHIPSSKLLQEDDSEADPFEVISTCQLLSGIGLSLVGNREEIIFASFDHITGFHKRTHKSELIELKLANVQIDNQLYDTHSPAIFYVEEGEENRKCAFSIELERQFDSSPGFHLFKFLHIELQNYVLTIDERILLKLLEFFGFGQKTNIEQTSHDISSARSIENFSEIKYFYFRDIFIHSTKLKTSMLTVSNLPPQLQAMKSQLGLKLVKFQAPINLSEYQRRHSFDSWEELLASIRNHYKSNLSSQAFKVLGSVDFLGNPLGLFNDVSKGITGLITLRHGFTGLLKDVTHGLSDSASKITGSAGNLASYMSFDKQFQRDREEMVPVAATTSILHLGAGISSFASGMFGGLTSIATSSYQGAQEGILGFVTGVGKGVAGTIAKPLAGTLDLVSSTSAALRAQTLSSSGNFERRRLPRCCVGSGGALPLYTERNAKGLHFFNQFSDWESSLGTFITLEDVRHTSEEYIQVVVSTGALYFINVTRKPKELQTSDVKLVVQHSRLRNIKISSKRLELNPDTVYFVYNLELEVLYDDLTPKLYPIQCHTQEIAIRLKQIFNYAKLLREEEKQVIPISNFEVHW